MMPPIDPFAYYILDDHSQPVKVETADDYREWLNTLHRDVRTPVGKLIRRTSDPHVEVVTSFIGIDLIQNGEPPALWQTLILGGRYDLCVKKYRSEDAALAGHSVTCDFAYHSRAR